MHSQNGTPFHLEYVSGSALLENGGFAKGNGVKLTGTITNQGNLANKAKEEWTLPATAGMPPSSDSLDVNDTNPADVPGLFCK